VIGETNISVPLESVIDVEKTREKLSARKQSIEKDLKKVQEILSNKDFASKAPQEKVNAINEQLKDLQQQLDNIDQQLKVLD